MRFRRLKHTFLRLSTEEKVTLIGGLAVLFSSFFPWYEVNLSINEKRLLESGFSGDLGVIGFVIFLITLLAVLTLVGEHMGFRMPIFGYQKERVILFLNGQSAFLLLLTLAVYTKRSFDFTNAEVRFGLYVAFIGALLSTFSIYAMIQKLKKRDVETFFGKEEELGEASGETEETSELVEESEPETPEVEQMSFTEVEKVQEEKSAPKEEFAEDELDDVVEFTETSEPEVVNVIEVIEEVVEEEPASEESPEEEPKKKSGSPSLGFYDD